MGRSKKDRAYSFKPQFKSFQTIGYKSEDEIGLNHDELEALFLMDYQDMYQEDAANMMNVSRPTLSRIIKSARYKLASALISGAKLTIRDIKKDFKIAISLDAENEFSKLSPKERLVCIIHIDNDKIKNVEYLLNPICNTKEKPSEIFPNFLKKRDVNFFVSSYIGAGLKHSLIAKGILVKTVDSIRKLEDLAKLFED